MPAYKDNSGKWYCSFHYSTSTGENKRKLKRGFTLKREAEEWERKFIENISFQPIMPFSKYVDLYLKEIAPQVRLNSLRSKKYKLKQILPTFEGFPLCEITSQQVRKWHNSLIENGFSEKYIKNLHKELSAIFNHAIRFHGLKENPCKKAGIPKVPNQEPVKMRFWTLEEYKAVISHVSDLKAFTAISLLYWTGIRKGELYALKWQSVDFNKKTISITHSFQRIQGEDILTATKTYQSREISIPSLVTNQMKRYKRKCYDTSPDNYVFPYDNEFIQQGIKEGTEKANRERMEKNLPPIDRIHVHGLRHSHASYLINHGVNIVLISKRLGHEKVSTTLDTYSHFFPKSEEAMIAMMNRDIKNE